MGKGPMLDFKKDGNEYVQRSSPEQEIGENRILSCENNYLIPGRSLYNVKKKRQEWFMPIHLLSKEG